MIPELGYRGNSWTQFFDMWAFLTFNLQLLAISTKNYHQTFLGKERFLLSIPPCSQALNVLGPVRVVLLSEDSWLHLDSGHHWSLRFWRPLGLGRESLTQGAVAIPKFCRHLGYMHAVPFGLEMLRQEELIYQNALMAKDVLTLVWVIQDWDLTPASPSFVRSFSRFLLVPYHLEGVCFSEQNRESVVRFREKEILEKHFAAVDFAFSEQTLSCKIENC